MENLQWGDFPIKTGPFIEDFQLLWLIIGGYMQVFLLKHQKHLKPSLDQSTSWFRAERRVNHSWCHHLYLKMQPKNGANCILMCFKLSGWHDTLIIFFPSPVSFSLCAVQTIQSFILLTTAFLFPVISGLPRCFLWIHWKNHWARPVKQKSLSTNVSCAETPILGTPCCSMSDGQCSYNNPIEWHGVRPPIFRQTHTVFHLPKWLVVTFLSHWMGNSSTYQPCFWLGATFCTVPLSIGYRDLYYLWLLDVIGGFWTNP